MEAQSLHFYTDVSFKKPHHESIKAFQGLLRDFQAQVLLVFLLRYLVFTQFYG